MTDNQLYRVFNRAKELGLEKICAYAILETIGLFDMNNSVAYNMAIEAIADEPDFCLKVVSQKDKKMYIYQTADVNERFFMESRENDLKEVFSNEKT